MTQPNFTRLLDVFGGMFVGVSFGLAASVILEGKSHFITAHDQLAIMVAVASQILGIAMILIRKRK